MEAVGVYTKAVVITLVAWFIGLVLDANIAFQPEGFLCLRLLLPILAMGICILSAIKQYGEKIDK